MDETQARSGGLGARTSIDVRRTLNGNWKIPIFSAGKLFPLCSFDSCDWLQNYLYSNLCKVMEKWPKHSSVSVHSTRTDASKWISSFNAVRRQCVNVCPSSPTTTFSFHHFSKGKHIDAITINSSPILVPFRYLSVDDSFRTGLVRVTEGEKVKWAHHPSSSSAAAAVWSVRDEGDDATRCVAMVTFSGNKIADIYVCVSVWNWCEFSFSSFSHSCYFFLFIATACSDA